MTDRSHLIALITRLSHERERLAAATTEGEREQRRVWVAQCEREIAAEEAFLGDTPCEDMSDEELLASLKS